MKYIALIFSLILTLILQAQNPTIIIGKEQHIDLGYPNHAFVETQLSINPNDPNHMLAGAIMVDPTKEDVYWDVALTTFDGGKNWNFHQFGVPQAADPWGIITESGEAIFSVLGYSNLYIYHSPDGGRTWNSDSLDLGGAHDHQVFVQDRSGGPFDKSVYLTSIQGSNVFTARSDDNGKSFEVASKFKANNLNTNTLMPVVLSDGSFISSYVNFQRYSTEDAEWLENEQTWIIKSTDGGKTYSPPLFVSEACGKGFDQLAVDRSNGQFNDRLYWLCAAPKDKALYFHYSPDKGNKWSKPFLLREIMPEIVDERPKFNGAAMISVNKDGVIGIIWQERVRDPKTKCQYLYFTASTDGGETFLPPVRVSNAPSCPEAGNNGWAGNRWKSGGDYQGFTAKQDGSFQVLWSDSRSGYFQLYTTEIKVKK